MRTIRIIVFCLLIATTSTFAQETANNFPANGITVLDLKWSRKISSPDLTPPPRREYENAGGRRQDPDSVLRTPSPVPNSKFPDRVKLPFFYLYSLKVKNVGVKAIKGVLWEYVTTDTVSGAELNRRRIINYQPIKRGSVATLETEYPSPPTNVVTPEGLGENEKSPFKERAEITCVLYKDDTLWQSPKSDGAACEQLRQVDAQVRSPQKKHD